MAERERNWELISQEYSRAVRLHVLPENLNKVVRLMYGTKCRTHNSINNNAHLTCAHGCRDLVTIAQDLQHAKNPEEARELDKELETNIKLINQLVSTR